MGRGAGGHSHSAEGCSKDCDQDPGLQGQGRACEPAVSSTNTATRRNRIHICHIRLVEVSSGKQRDLLEPLFLLL